jgi:hypothetical protein
MAYSNYFYPQTPKQNDRVGFQISANIIPDAKIKYALHLGRQRLLDIKGI